MANCYTALVLIMKVRALKLLRWSALVMLALGAAMVVGILSMPYATGETIGARLTGSVAPLLFYGAIVWAVLSALLLAVFGADALLSRRRAV